MQIWSINYSFSKHQDTNILYIGRYLALTYRESFFFNSLLIFSYISLSVNCMSWVSKFHNFFLTCSETEARFIFEIFKYCPFWKNSFHISGTFLAFFNCSVNCSRDLFSHFVSQQIVWVESLNTFKRPFQPLCQSANCMSWVFEHVTYFREVQKVKH